ncbi:uncharacterized protein LOC118457784 [Anopheles albimanus]|uniref:uncharacterized protein LOC118457784 n=1 Tax=Anopheles albimanus TaxID=7167 RepID=UPI00163F2BD9|nr:uncharacterized protein LOC118457784 [Anopheles albimanus]
MEYTKDERTVPEWLNDEFFLNVIREYTRDDRAQLCHGCKLRPGTKPGEHFASIMYRTTIHYRTGGNRGREASQDVIMKIKPFQGGLKKEILEDSDLFVKEMHVYSKVLPEMARRLGAIGETLNFPRLIYATVKPHTILILEDVTGKGWRTGEYITTYEEVIPSVKAIANFHAASVVIGQDDSSFIVENQCNIANQLRALDGMTTKSIDNLLGMMHDNQEFDSLIKPVEKLKATLLDTLIESYSPSGTYLNVFIHGDFHSKNLLHQLNADGRVQDTMLIDYQICSWTTPAVDVHYLLDTIIDQSLKETHRDKIVCLYYEEFCRLLVRLGYIGHLPGLMELQIELLRKGALELFHYVTLYPFRFIDRSKINFEELLSGKASNPAAHSETYRRVMKTVLSRFLQQGVMAS